jgi:ribosomal protein S18 acetylase RimI-like enzyme
VIRSAVPIDASKAVPLILEALGSIASVLTGTNDRKEVGVILDQFFRQRGNRVSYENALVLEESKETADQIGNNRPEGIRQASVEQSREVVGVALIYDGSIARALDEALEKAAARKSGLSDYRIPTEAEPSEFYLDTLSVDPKCQGRGFGRDLIEASCTRARKLGRNRIGLLVDTANLGAKRLYERLEFRVEGRKQIAGYEYFHMVRNL